MKKCFKFLCIGMLLHIVVLDARAITIVIASQSSQKIAAVKSAFEQKFADDDCVYLSYATYSGIPEQPIGHACALQGAYNRLRSVPKDIEADYIVVIENYIEKSLATQRWYDKGLILVQHKSQEKVIETKPIFIPDVYVQLAQQLSQKICENGYTSTVGMAIQQSFHDRIIDPSNWHQEPEFGGVSRQELLQDALFKFLYADELNFLKSCVLVYPDFPKVGITFANFLPIVHNGKAFQLMIDMLDQRYSTKNIDVIVGLESRGFILGAALAYKLGVPFVPIRKPGKLPGLIYSVDYQKEYGFDTLVIAQDALQVGQRVLIIDDLIATGGSARAAIELVQQTGGIPAEFISLLQVTELKEHAILPIPSFNLID